MPDRTSPLTRAAYLGFAVFGGFWGTWGASVPAMRDQTGITDGQLGTALLFVGAGALPAMPLAGWLVDRRGHRVAGTLLVALGLAGVLVTATARDLVSLAAGLTALGAASGAADVAINAVAGSAQQASGRPVIARAHATFSACVVVASLATGGVLAAGLAPVIAFAVLTVGSAAAALALGRALPPRPGALPGTQDVPAATRRSLRQRTGPLRPLLLLGGLGALAFAVENGHQSWSALYLTDVVDAGPATAAAGPAVFATVVALTRWGTAHVGIRHPAAVLLAGSLAAAGGTAVLAAAGSLDRSLMGLALAAAGTAVLFPTLLGVLTSQVPDRVRGAATSVVSTVAYLGFLAGPVYVGRWADAVDLPGAMAALAALALVLAVLAPAAIRRIQRRADVPARSRGASRH